MAYKKYANCEIMGLAHQAKESFVEIEKKISLVSDDMSSIAEIIQTELHHCKARWREFQALQMK